MFYDGKEISSIVVAVELHLEVAGTVVSGTMDGEIMTLFDNQQKQSSNMVLPPVTSETDYQIGYAQVDEATLILWSQGQFGLHTLDFETSDLSVLTVNFADGYTDQKTFSKASAMIEVQYQSDSGIIIGDINLGTGMEEPEIPPIPSLYRGVVVSDTAWYPFGYYFNEPQLELISNHGNAVYLMLEKGAWESGDQNNVLGIPYPDYIKQIVQIAHQKGMWVAVSLTNDYSTGNVFGAEEKWNVISDFTLRTEWIDWGKDVVTHVKPDAICIMNEPNSPTNDLQLQIDRFHYYWNIFALPNIDTYRSVDPDITVIVPPCPWYRTWWMEDYVDDRSNILVSYHLYYKEAMDWGYEDEPFNHESARNNLWSYIDGRLSNSYGMVGSIDHSKVIFDEFGVWSENINGEGWTFNMEPTIKNWRYAMMDFYEYAEQRSMYGYFQYAVGLKYYSMLNPDTGYMSFSPYGQWWANYQP